MALSRPEGRIWRNKRTGKWSFNVVGRNAEIVVSSGPQQYSRRIDCIKMVERAMEGFGATHFVDLTAQKKIDKVTKKARKRRARSGESS